MTHNCSNKLPTEVAMTAGVFPFLYLALTRHSQPGNRFAWIVFVNGVLCHMSSGTNMQWAAAFKIFDIACNVLMVTIVNFTTAAQPATAWLTTVATLVFATNLHETVLWRRAFKHILGVQMPLCVALALY